MTLTCWLFGHDDRRERDAQGRYVLACDRCEDRRVILADQKLRIKKVPKPRKRKSAEVLRIAPRKEA